jgi:hypothetical protein
MDVGSTARNTPVMAVEPGTVERIGNDANRSDALRGYGNAVVVRADSGPFWVLYAHMANLQVSVGQRVREGQLLGYMSNTTNGQFSPLPGESRSAWSARRAAETGGRAPRFMNPHLHLEVRRAREDGSSPFLPTPTPYPDTPQAAVYNLDPAQYLAAKGITFAGRGGIEITPGGEADLSRASWQQSAAMAGLLGQIDRASGMGALSTGSKSTTTYAPGPAPTRGVYEPVVQERDVRFGLRPIEWGLLAGGAVVFVAGGAALIVSRSLRKNSRRVLRRRHTRS